MLPDPSAVAVSGCFFVCGRADSLESKRPCSSSSVQSPFLATGEGASLVPPTPFFSLFKLPIAFFHSRAYAISGPTTFQFLPPPRAPAKILAGLSLVLLDVTASQSSSLSGLKSLL